MKIRILTIIILLVFTTVNGISQIAIKGKVLDERKEPIIGANIIEKGSKTGKMTDVDGNFSLTVSNSKATLVISYIGMRTLTLPLAGKTDLYVIMESNTVEHLLSRREFCIKHFPPLSLNKQPVIEHPKTKDYVNSFSLLSIQGDTPTAVK